MHSVTPEVETGYGAESVEIASRVVEEVAEAQGADPMNLEPLFHSIEPDALNNLFKNHRDVKVTFEYEGYTVTIQGDHRIDLAK